MDNIYIQLQSSLKRLKEWKEQKKSLKIWIVITIILLPIALFLIGWPILSIYEVIQTHSFYEWGFSWNFDIAIIILISFWWWFGILCYIYLWLSTDIKIILLIKKLEVFNDLWEKKSSKMEKIDEILDIIISIHNTFKNISILKKYAYTKDSKYLFLEKTEIRYFYNILTQLQSELNIKISEQQNSLESAKSEVERNINGTPELLAVSEEQKIRLDRQIEQFEELQKRLVKV